MLILTAVIVIAGVAIWSVYRRLHPRQD